MLDQASWYIPEPTPSGHNELSAAKSSAVPAAASPRVRETERLLMRMVELQERQLYWTRITAIVAFGAFVLVFAFGVTIKLR